MRRFVAMRILSRMVVGPLVNADRRVIAVRRGWVGPLLVRMTLAVVTKGQVFAHLVPTPAIAGRPLPPVLRLAVLLIGL